MRRRLDLAAGLVTRPPVLFLDEPTTGLDPTSRVRMWGVIRELVDDGATLLLTTQYLDEADELADRDRRHRPRPRDRDRHGRRAEGAESAAPGSRSPSPSPTRPRPTRSPRWSTGAVHVSHDGRRLRAPVRSGPASRPRSSARSTTAGVTRRRRRRPPALARRRVLRPHRPRRSRLRRANRLTPTWRLRRMTHHRNASPADPRTRGADSPRRSATCVLTGRNLVHIAREPLQLSDVTVQPVLFTLLFVYVFGAGVVLPERRQLHRLRDRRPARAQPDDVVDGHGGRAQHRPQRAASSTASARCRCGGRPCSSAARSPTC